MLCCVQSGLTALYWAAWRGDANIVQIMVDYGATVDLGRDVVTSHDYLLTCGWSFGCGFIQIVAGLGVTSFASEDYSLVPGLP